MSFEIKKKIENGLKAFSEDNLTPNSLNFFNTLGYNTERQASLDKPKFSAFKAAYIQGSTKFNEEKALAKEWKYVDLLFQLSKDEVTRQNSLFDSKRVDNRDIQSYLFFVIELSGAAYTRTAFSQITREVNKLFPMPAMILFKTGNNLTLSVINRRLHKKDESKDVLEKVTLIKDISIENPHRAHIEILFDLSFDELLARFKFTNFVELHNAWQKTLDTKELNKRFYQELSSWYFWAKDKVQFPADVEKDEDNRNSINLIRLITRIVFIWFVKEKDLVPDSLFDQARLSSILKEFNHNKKSANYYSAVLQNLFFGTLNQKMDERGFAKNGTIEENRNEYGVKNLFRYADLFSISEKEVLTLFQDVPFLNGGLFDCLDKPDDSGKILYSDGFSRNPKKRAIVPDYLFFGNEQECDLNEIFGTRNKKYKVKGLIEILSSYKFTIAENTPLEEEVALDPELLGKVFENLLASYNPETQTTARKQTGSFYTPREIVDYMVNESLIAYLERSLTPEKNLTPGSYKNLTPAPSPKERGEKSLRLPGYITTDPATYKTSKQFALENRRNATDAEALLWEELRNQNLGRKFRRQHPIDKFIADFVCLEEKLVIEVDGNVHDTQEQKDYDAMRTKRLKALGFSEIRFSNEQILSNLKTVLQTIIDSFSSSPSPSERGLGGEVSSQAEGEVSPETDHDVSSRLRDLLSYSENPNPFSPEETASLIFAIDNCKILDPACGSGAFPMGVLHKLVHVLHKIDPQNKQWKERQIQKARTIDDVTIREHLIDDIETAFESNGLDYGRKLYLIENCIYGVDIQPIAVQIAKLRFFISLIIDQNKRPEKENLGVRSLPNLETKFVAADSLIALERHYDEKGGETLFRNADAITQLEEELRKIRHSYFSAKTRKEKLKYQKQDKEKREAIANELVVMRFSEDDIVKLKNYDPYDQSHGASFFDSEWMFGLRQPNKTTGVFDIVIGNPPYVQIQNFSGMQQQKDWERQKFETYVKTGDVYCLFYERGFRLLKNGGVLTFITSNKWMRANYGKVMRKFINNNGSVLQLIDFGDSPIFENATTYTNILVWKKIREKVKTKAWDLSKAYAIDAMLEGMLEKQGECDALFTEDSYVVVKSEQTAIKRKIEQMGIPLKDWDISIYRGILTGLNEAFIIDGKKKDELIAKDPKSAEILKPILRGRDIKRYKAEFADLWLIFIPWHFPLHEDISISGNSLKAEKAFQKNYPTIYKHFLEYKNALSNRNKEETGIRYEWYALQRCAASYYQEFEKEKISYSEIVFDSAFTIDANGFYPEATTFTITGERLKFLTALLNSKLLTYAFKKFYAGGDLRGDTFRYKKVFLEFLPVPKLSNESQLPFEILVDCILFCKSRDNADLDSCSSLLESVIDGLAYDLYFPEEMKAAHCYITDRISEVLKPFKKNDTVAFKTEYITELCKFFHKDETIYHGLIHRRTIKEVQIISGDKS